jgi:alpha,alpha-trehalose phosphorylase
VAAIDYVVEAVDGPVRLMIQSELVANEAVPTPGDARVSAVLDHALRSEQHGCDGVRVDLVHRTRRSGLVVAAGMDHVVHGPRGTKVVAESSPDLGRLTVTVTLGPRERLHVTKFVSYGWSATRSREALRDQVDAALMGARQAGWRGLVAEQRDYLNDFWKHSDVEVDGDAEIQQAVRFALFHVLQAGARAEGRAIAAKGLTGSGYDGHAF